MEKRLVRSCMLVGTLLAVMTLSAQTFAQYEAGDDYRYYFNEYGVEVINNPGVEITYPIWAKPNPEQNITDLSYWVKEVLPFAEDRNATKYIVYPKHGVVVPVLIPSESDQTLIAKGEMFDHYPYLEKGALHYFGYDAHKGYGNMVIAGHSSYNKSAKGNYKTTFQVLPISKAGEKIFIYLKNDKGTFDFYEYTITKSFRTNKYNVGIMQHTPDSFTLTTYGCYVIGSNEERWVNVATMTATKLAQSDLSKTSMHTSAEDEPSSIISEKTPTTQEPVATNTVTKQIQARSVSLSYSAENEVNPKDTRLSISELISARATYQARDAQEAVATPVVAAPEPRKEPVVAVAVEVKVESAVVQSAADIIAALLRPKMSLHQEIIINARAKHVVTSSSPKQLEEFIMKLKTKKDSLSGKTDKVSLWKDVVITHILDQLTPAQ